LRRSVHPEIPDPQFEIAGFRSVLAHAYTRIDFELAWKTIVADLTVLKQVVDEEMN
jgi:uncharacterized protein with HEPN domain